MALIAIVFCDSLLYKDLSVGLCSGFYLKIKTIREGLEERNGKAEYIC